MNPATDEPYEDAPLVWKNHPVAEEPWSKSALLVTLLVAFPCTIGMVYTAAWGWLGALMLGGSMAPYFIIHRFRLDRHGVSRRLGFWTTRKPWRDFGRAVKTAEGVFLGCGVHPRRLDAFRGLFLRCSEEKVLEVFDYARRHIEKTHALETTEERGHSGLRDSER